jgi:hypothetical protein
MWHKIINNFLGPKKWPKVINNFSPANGLLNLIIYLKFVKIVVGEWVAAYEKLFRFSFGLV